MGFLAGDDGHCQLIGHFCAPVNFAICLSVCLSVYVSHTRVCNISGKAGNIYINFDIE